MQNATHSFRSENSSTTVFSVGSTANPNNKIANPNKKVAIIQTKKIKYFFQLNLANPNKKIPLIQTKKSQIQTKNN
jgi:hypothetical protein